MNLKKGDFVEIEYTGKVKSTGEVFDTTSEEIAKQHGLYDENNSYGAVAVCLGAEQLLPGLDSALVGKEVGKTYTIEVSPEEGFGKKDPKLLRLIATSKFRRQGITPVPGLRINIDGVIGTIKTVTGGRTIVDFNHPLSGQVVEYEVKIVKKLSKPDEKLGALIRVELLDKNPKLEITDGKAKLKLSQEYPKELLDKFKEKALKLIPELSEIEFE